MSSNSAIQTPLADKELLQLVKTRILDYPKLKQFKNINQLLQPYGSAIILIITHSVIVNINGKKKTVKCGHWCALLYTVGGIEFFDPYGVFPDHEFKEIGHRKRIQFKQERNEISRLLETARKAGIPIMFNQFPLQKRSPYVNTCGRWCALRILCRNQSVEQFSRDWNDNSVTAVTEKMLYNASPTEQIQVQEEEEELPPQNSLWGTSFNMIM